MSHHLVTACMLCLLCAAHSCWAHAAERTHQLNVRYGSVTPNENIDNIHLPDLKNFEDNVIPQIAVRNNEDYLNPYRFRVEDTHGVRKKNLADEKRARYLNRLSRVKGESVNKDEVVDDSINERLNFGAVAFSGDGKVLSDSLASDLDLPSIDQLNQRIGASELIDSSMNSASRHRRVRDARLAMEAASKGKKDGSKMNLRDIDPSVYLKSIFRRFGDEKSMTMNASGFDEMLNTLHLVKMISNTEGDTGGRAIDGAVTPVAEAANRCVNSERLVASINAAYVRQTHSHEDHHHHEHSSREDAWREISEGTLQAVCPILLYQKMAQTGEEREGCLRDDNLKALEFDSDGNVANTKELSAYYQNRTAVWMYSLLSIFAISACGLLGVAVIPVMHKSYYHLLLQFLVALAVGTLCGDALLHLMPHAMAPHDHTGNAVEVGHDDAMWKGLVAMMGVVFFYFTEKGLTVLAEWRKRRQKLDKENKLPSRVRVMRDDAIGGCSGGAKAPHTNSSGGFLKIFNSKKQDNGDPTTKLCKHKYSEYPYCYDEIATDTHDDHHVRDGQIPSSPNQNDDKKNNVSVVSSNALNKEAEPTANDWLLNHIDDGDANGKSKCGNKEQLGVEMNSVGKKVVIKDDGENVKWRGEVVDGAGKDIKDAESYTVILREHSSQHHGHSHSHGHVHAPPSSMSSVAWMVILGDGLHNFTDGMAIGAAFSSNLAGGFSTAIAVLCHELPHELGDFAVLVKAGMSVRRAVCYNVLSSALCLVGALCGVLAGHTPEATQWLFAAAAGMFIYIALVDMMPELSSSHSKEGTLLQCFLQLLGLCSGVGVMLVIALYENDLKRLFN